MEKLGKGFSWLDTRTYLIISSKPIYSNNTRKSRHKNCLLEEVAFRMKYISKNDILKNINNICNNSYFDCVGNLAKWILQYKKK